VSPPETGRRRAGGGIDGPMSAIEFGILGLYFLTLVILAIMGIHRYLMVYLYFKHREKKAAPVPLPEQLPRVTIQLPIFNEMYVLDRLLESVVQIRYPRERLQIQVLDDSTDETTSIASRAVLHYRALGFDMEYLHRTDRTGYKAGALDAGLRSATGEFVLIFDADFVAPPDVLEKTIGHFQDPQVGMVQARWGHINRDYSLLTEVQSIMLDGHFIMEHGARSRSGRFFNFNGTAGVWRRAVIDDAGGWQHDTLTEDLDLSYRAQLRGWRFVYTPDLVSPAELPVEMNAFKTQQQRWAKGSVQVCKKLLPRILASNDLPWKEKAEATFHLTANLAYPLMVLLAALMFPAMLLRYNMGWAEMLVVDVPIFLAATASVCAFYVISQKEQFPDTWKAKVKYIPAVLGIGVGISLSNALAVVEGLFGKPSEFTRTPKYGIEGASDTWKQKVYKGKGNWLPYAELALACYFTFVNLYALTYGLVGTLPFIAIFQWGFLYTSGMSLAQSLDWLVPREQEA
jgi:cellulose synthase/poly-beta-1,6-N-acetylglucosamine synthase-like glycosyltransferase